MTKPTKGQLRAIRRVTSPHCAVQVRRERIFVEAFDAAPYRLSAVLEMCREDAAILAVALSQAVAIVEQQEHDRRDLNAAREGNYRQTKPQS
jgi:hypothetical protein